MPNIEVYTRPGCGYCTAAKAFFKTKSLSFIEYDVYATPDRKNELARRVRYSTYPQIFINNQSIGGFDNLSTMSDLKLSRLLSSRVSHN